MVVSVLEVGFHTATVVALAGWMWLREWFPLHEQVLGWGHTDYEQMELTIQVGVIARAFGEGENM